MPASAPESSHRVSRSGRRLKVLLVLLLPVAATIAYQVWSYRGHQAVVEEGRLYRSAALPPSRLARFCSERGIRTVIDFRRTEADAREEAEILEHMGVRHVHLPSRQVPSSETIAAFLEIMQETAGEPVLLHCRHGVGRAGVFSAIYRMEYQGWSAPRAWLEAAVLAGFGSFLPGSPKARFILSYHRPTAAAAPAEPRP